MQRGVHVETMLRIGEPTAREDFDAKALPSGLASQQTRGLFAIFIWLKHLLARSNKQLNDEQIELAPHDCK